MLLLFSSFSLVSGCIGEDASPGDVEEASGTGGEAVPRDGPGQWRLDGRTRTVLTATAEPFSPVNPSITVIDGCDLFQFQVPRTTHELAVTVRSDPVNSSQPGAGYGTVKIKQDDGERWIEPDDSEPSKTHTLSASDPRPGTWSVWIRPWGPAVNQVFDVEVRIQGTGPSPSGPSELVPAGLGC